MARKTKDRLPRVKLGQCYHNTYRAILRCKHGFSKQGSSYALEFTGFYLVHGLLLMPPGREHAGKLLGHAWIEDESNVYELPKTLREKPRVTPRTQYYAMYSLTDDRVRRYTPAEAAAVGLAAGHSGPWDSAVEQKWGHALLRIQATEGSAPSSS
jgi:hypothetical protein